MYSLTMCHRRGDKRVRRVGIRVYGGQDRTGQEETHKEDAMCWCVLCVGFPPFPVIFLSCERFGLFAVCRGGSLEKRAI